MNKAPEIFIFIAFYLCFFFSHGSVACQRYCYRLDICAFYLLNKGGKNKKLRAFTFVSVNVRRK